MEMLFVPDPYAILGWERTMWMMPFDDEGELGDLIAINMANMMPF